ncbi:MAG: hypothetical protein IPK80_31130 [Nannocystis sp.]|nr:hypothetical protein [Nannocystis sp.]
MRDTVRAVRRSSMLRASGRLPRSRLALFLFVLLSGQVGCGGDSGGASASEAGSSEASASSTGSTSDASDASTTAATTSADTGESEGESTSGGPILSEDELLLRQAIAGEVDPAEALATVADRGGLPVLTSTGGFLFACLCGDGAWQTVGDHNGWSGGAMTLSGALWWAEQAIATPEESKYKFFDGEALYQADPWARRYGYDDFGEFSLVRSTAPHRERWYGISGEGLAPRSLYVWVPGPGAPSRALFAHDGQNLFGVAGMTWKLHEMAPPGLLIVGIANTGSDRIDEYTHTTDVINGVTMGGKGDAYAALVEETIRPKIEAAYGAAPTVGLLGSSLGGLISLHIADLYPERYDMVISMSATLGWGSRALNNPTMIEIYEAKGRRPFAIYLDSGGGDGGMACVDADMDGIKDDNPAASDNYCENVQMRDTLAAIGHEFGVDLWHWFMPDAAHNEGAWGERMELPLSLFMGLPGPTP